MANDDKRKRLAVGYVHCKDIMKAGGADVQSMARVEDIMLASIRTLDFLWGANADKTMDYVLESVLRHMALVAADATKGDHEKIYMEMITRSH